MQLNVGVQMVALRLSAWAFARRLTSSCTCSAPRTTGKGCASPSVGQRQLTAVTPDVDGREPSILFLEGATAHVNSANEHINQLALAGLLGKLTFIAAAHRLPTLSAAGYIVEPAAS